MATATRKLRTQGHAGRPTTDVNAAPMEFLTFEDNAGDFYWTIVDGAGVTARAVGGVRLVRPRNASRRAAP